MSTLCLSNNCQQTTLYDRVSKLLDSFEWSDCSFLVGKEIIKAHKLILAISSPVFKVMLYGPMAEVTPIVISDIEPEVFQLLLNFIYKDKVTINSLENACGLLYAAKKYMIPYLAEICLKYIENATSIKNVFPVFNFSDWLQEDNLSAYCLKLICKHAEIVLYHENEHLSVSCMKRILSQQSINIGEKDLINFVKKWVEEECSFRKISLCIENKRKILIDNNLMAQLRFFTLKPDDMKWLASTGLLQDKELEIIENILVTDIITKDTSQMYKSGYLSDVCNNYRPCIWNNTNLSRNIMKLDWSYCCRPVIRTANPLVIDSRSQNIKVRIKCKKTVFINSFSIPTRQSPEISFGNESPLNYLEYIHLTVNNDITPNDSITKIYSREVEYNSNIYIDLPEPFIFNEEEWYTVSFSWPRKKSENYKYPLCYRPITNYNSEADFTFDDNFEKILLCGSFVEGLKFCV